ncbi:MAG: hypothetical protein ACREOO_04595 [bacterium]
MKSFVFTPSLVLVLISANWGYAQTTRAWNNYYLNVDPESKAASMGKFLAQRFVFQEKSARESFLQRFNRAVDFRCGHG